jgi:hypothetical protein
MQRRRLLKLGSTAALASGGRAAWSQENSAIMMVTTTEFWRQVVTDLENTPQ